MTYSSQPFSTANSHLECPSCGKHSIVQHKETHYICLSCNWEKDIAEPPAKSPGPSPLPFWLATAVIFLLLI